LKYTDDGFNVETTQGEIQARCVVNAAGLFTDAISAFLGIRDFKVHPRRGQYHILDRAAPLGVQHIILPVPTKISKGKLLTPSVYGNWLIGATAEELEDKSSHNTTSEGLEEVVRDVQKLVPAVTPKFAIAQYAGLRPARTPDGYHFRTFVQFPGYLELSGIRSTGISASLAIARYACGKLMEMGILSFPLKENFIARREGIPCFREAGNQRREELIQQDPRYAHIICRCETVTEAEIVQAIRRTPGARDLDGIKRRVRAGLGRCQAGFCGMRIPQILSRELNISMQQVTKKGKGSELFIGHTKSLRGTR